MLSPRFMLCVKWGTSLHPRYQGFYESHVKRLLVFCVIFLPKSVSVHHSYNDIVSSISELSVLDEQPLLRLFKQK